MSTEPRIRVASAPVSWGVMEGTDENYWPSSEQVLGEIAAAGYAGTELGPYGFYPTEREALRATLQRHRLDLLSAFVPLRWFQPEYIQQDLTALMDVAHLLAALDCGLIVLADAMAPPGSTAPDDRAWRQATSAVEDAARKLAPLGLRTVVHLEADSYWATPDDQDRLCALTDPDLVGICLDTGHYAYSFGDPRDALRTHGKRIRYVHLKDVDAGIRARAAATAMSFDAAVRAGVFTPLGDGCANIAGVIDDLRALEYSGWVVAEQDVLGPFQDGTNPLENARRSRAFLHTCGL